MRKLSLSVDNGVSYKKTKNLSQIQQNSTLKTAEQDQPIKWDAISTLQKVTVENIRGFSCSVDKHC